MRLTRRVSFATVAIAAIVVAGHVHDAAAQQQITIETSGPVGVGAEAVGFPGLLGAGRQMKTGTGRITGRVLSAETGAPVRRAQVRISAPEIGVKTSLTDTDGRFEFKDLPAGRFSVNATKSGYVNVGYGQTRPFESGRPIELADKQVLDKIDITMPRGGVISGRIVDEYGEPVAEAVVSSMRQTWSNGRRRLTPTGRAAQTNDLGQFRMYGLPPGEYFVSATLRNTDLMMIDAAAIIGGPSSGASGSTPSAGYAPTYYPGTTVAGNAQRITVAIGQEAQNTDFALAPVRLARIAGTVISSEGKPLEGGMVTATPLNRSGEVALMVMGASTGRTSKDGTFSINGVAPGDYVLNVRTLRINISEGGGGDTMMFRTIVGGDGADAETASLPVTVGGEDLTNVIVVTSKGGTAAGRLTFEGTSQAPALTGVRITAMAADADGPTLGGGGGAGTVKADGTFEIKGLSGRRLIRVANLPQGWMLKAVRLNADDVTDAGVDFKSGQEISGLEIVATSKLTEIAGAATATNGTPLKDYTVILFSDDAQLWNLPATRWVTGARPNQDGRFRIRNVPAGTYNIVAVDYVEQGAWGDPELLERLKTRAKRITVAEGGTETVDLKLVEQY